MPALWSRSRSTHPSVEVRLGGEDWGKDDGHDVERVEDPRLFPRVAEDGGDVSRKGSELRDHEELVEPPYRAGEGDEEGPDLGVLERGERRNEVRCATCEEEHDSAG